MRGLNVDPCSYEAPRNRFLFGFASDVTQSRNCLRRRFSALIFSFQSKAMLINDAAPRQLSPRRILTKPHLAARSSDRPLIALGRFLAFERFGSRRICHFYFSDLPLSRFSFTTAEQIIVQLDFAVIRRIQLVVSFFIRKHIS